MVEPVGSLAKLLGRTVTPVAPAAAAPAVKPVASGADEAQVAATAVTAELAARPPVDADRVAELKRAVASGSYPVEPAAIADRLLAMKLDWRPGQP